MLRLYVGIVYGPQKEIRTLFCAGGWFGFVFSGLGGHLQRCTKSAGPYPLGGVRSVARVFSGVGLWHGFWLPHLFKIKKVLSA